ncbi:hypothetical protein LXA43DRAFT_1062127 [Ganoderma leucocontextum]|nr:hypothetical protein LXA43DRAFT_1062127 [Ganoderma leucocontextum]
MFAHYIFSPTSLSPRSSSDIVPLTTGQPLEDLNANDSFSSALTPIEDSDTPNKEQVLPPVVLGPTVGFEAPFTVPPMPATPYIDPISNISSLALANTSTLPPVLSISNLRPSQLTSFPSRIKSTFVLTMANQEGHMGIQAMLIRDTDHKEQKELVMRYISYKVKASWRTLKQFGNDANRAPFSYNKFKEAIYNFYPRVTSCPEWRMDDLNLISISLEIVRKFKAKSKDGSVVALFIVLPFDPPTFTQDGTMRGIVLAASTGG